jgi:hypothetical protein
MSPPGTVNRSARLDGLFHLMYRPPMDEVNKIWTPKKKDQSADTNKN